MRFLALYKPAENPDSCANPSPEKIATMGKFVEECVKSGVLLSTEGLTHTAKGARVRLSAGQYRVIDGPFIDTDGLVCGYAILRTNSKEEAINIAKEFLSIAGDGESELRQLYEPEDFGPCSHDDRIEAAEAAIQRN